MQEQATEVEIPIGGGPGPLAEEIACYRRHLSGWAEHEGEHVLIKGGAVIGFHPTRNEALADGYRRFGRVPFLVKQVVMNEKPVTIGAIR